MAKTVEYTWQGQWNPDPSTGGGWYEYFGEPDGLPARDLTDEDLRGFNAEQRAKLKSDAGQRLYRKVEHRDAKPKSASKRKPETTTGTGNGGGQVIDLADVKPAAADPGAGGDSVPDAGVPEATP